MVLEYNILENKNQSFHNALSGNCTRRKILEPGAVYVYNFKRITIILATILILLQYSNSTGKKSSFPLTLQ